MSKYHINPETGEPGLCSASIRDCPLGGSEAEHYETKAEARRAYEEIQKTNSMTTSTKKSKNSSLPQKDKEFIPADLGAVSYNKSSYGWTFFFYNDPATNLGETDLDDFIEIEAKGYGSLVKEVDFFIKSNREYLDRTANNNETSKTAKIERLRAERDLAHLEALRKQINTEDGLKQIDKHGKAVSKAIDALYEAEEIQDFNEFGPGLVKKVFDYGNRVREREPNATEEEFSQSLWKTMRDNEPNIVESSTPPNELSQMYKIVQPILSKVS